MCNTSPFRSVKLRLLRRLTEKCTDLLNLMGLHQCDCLFIKAAKAYNKVRFETEFSFDFRGEMFDNFRRADCIDHKYLCT